MPSPKDIWEEFFKACDLPTKLRQQYAESFVGQRIQPNMLKDLDKEMLKELGINVLGDQLAILRYIKQTDGINAPAFKLIQSNSKEPVTTSSSNSEPSERHVMRAKATSSSRATPMISRSITIQKQQTVRPRVSGLRSDEILQERAAATHRRDLPSSYKTSRPMTVSARQSSLPYNVREARLMPREHARRLHSTSSSGIRDRITHNRESAGRRHHYYD